MTLQEWWPWLTHNSIRMSNVVGQVQESSVWHDGAAADPFLFKPLPAYIWLWLLEVCPKRGEFHFLFFPSGFVMWFVVTFPPAGISKGVVVFSNLRVLRSYLNLQIFAVHCVAANHPGEREHGIQSLFCCLWNIDDATGLLGPIPFVLLLDCIFEILACVWSLYSFPPQCCCPSIFLRHLLWISVICFIYYKNYPYSHTCKRNCGHGARRGTTSKVLS